MKQNFFFQHTLSEASLLQVSLIFTLCLIHTSSMFFHCNHELFWHSLHPLSHVNPTSITLVTSVINASSLASLHLRKLSFQYFWYLSTAKQVEAFFETFCKASNEEHFWGLHSHLLTAFQALIHFSKLFFNLSLDADNYAVTTDGDVIRKIESPRVSLLITSTNLSKLN